MLIRSVAFRINMPERLQKLSAQAGYGSRRACKEFITAGRIQITAVSSMTRER
jgi:16S rRNA U516 pseudouridylate synthase RsuA-like enzyme